jgi:threonine/homoserine/homoserine lactone efflux protein
VQVGYPRARRSCDGVPPEGGERGLTNPYMQGLLTNLTNPKAPLFFHTFLPQFVTAGSPLVPQLLILAIDLGHSLLAFF